MRAAHVRVPVGLVALALALASAPALAADKPVELKVASGEVPEESLLDVGVEVFAAGVEDRDEDELADKGILAEVRRSEARFIPFRLRDTLQGSGHWGAVRLVPVDTVGLDVVVSGRIERSDGKQLRLRVSAHDATGKKWWERTYEGKADRRAYAAQNAAATAAPTLELPRRDPFQDLYNRIANDLLAARQKLKAKDVARVRDVARLRFAASIAPDAFAAYLKTGNDGRVSLVRLPAAEDPMLQRVTSIRDRDGMFVDTLNEFYAGFVDRMAKPYDDWRAYSFEEQMALDKIRRESRLKTILGAIAIIGGAMIDDDGDNDGDRDTASGGIKDVLIAGGAIAVQAGLEQGKEAGVHKAAIRELAESFEAEVAPLLVDVEGQTLRLSGTAEAQFGQWRQMLRDIFAHETGVPTDPNAPLTVPAPVPTRTPKG